MISDKPEFINSFHIKHSIKTNDIVQQKIKFNSQISNNNISRSKSMASINSKYKDSKIEKILNKDEQERRDNIANELAKIDLSGKNIND